FSSSRSRAPPGCQCSLGACCVQSRCQRIERRGRAAPSQLVHVVEELDISPKRGESSKKYGVVPLATKGNGEGARVCGIHSPFAAVLRNRFKVKKLGEHGG